MSIAIDPPHSIRRPVGRDEPAGHRATGATTVDASTEATRTAATCCETCAAPVRVFVLEGYRDGQRVERHYCLRCACSASAVPLGPRIRVPRLSAFALVALVGVGLGTVGGFADALVPEVHAGFGWFQRCGVVAGALLVFLGALLHTDLIALGGLALFATALGIDWLGADGHAPGVGWKQQIALALCVVCLLVAVFGRLRLPRVPPRRREAAPSPLART